MYKRMFKYNQHITLRFLLTGILLTATLVGAQTGSSHPKYFILGGIKEKSSSGFFLSHTYLTEAENDNFRRKLDALKIPRGQSPGPRVKLKSKEYPRILRDLKTVNVLTQKGVLDLPISSVNLFFTVDGTSDYPLGLFVELNTLIHMNGLVVIGGKFPPNARIRPEGISRSNSGMIAENVWKHVISSLDAGAEKAFWRRDHVVWERSRYSSRDVSNDEEIRSNVWKQVTSSLDTRTKKALETSKVSPAQLDFLGVNLPTGEAEVIFYRDSTSDVENVFRFGAVVDKKGALVFSLMPPTYCNGGGICSWTPNFITDIDRDGVDELVATTGDGESLSTVLYKISREGKMTTTKLDTPAIKAKVLETAKRMGGLRFVSGKFPNGAVWLVYYENPNYDGFRFSALVDAKGTVVFTLKPPTYGTGEGEGSWTPDFIADIDGDGFEEIIGSDMGYEGSGLTVLYQVRDGKMTETNFD